MKKVQDSSDCCINSKYSSAKNGYFKDDYLSLFTEKFHRRSPIINRGYYIRFEAIEKVFQSWLSTMNSTNFQKCQIISLGAGYDSSYLRLKNNNKLAPGCHYVEIDFPEVMKRKYEFIKDAFCSDQQNLKETLPSIVLCTKEYSMLGVDLIAIPDLEKNFALIGIDYEIPTLFLSECSIIYIDPKDSDTFISWVQKCFIHSAFVSYEQVYPFDAFGLIMRNHFNQVGCSLKSITKYPDEESQRKRYKKLGWPECDVINMYDFFMSFTSEEKLRIQQLEMFDEYEMWHEKCLHYGLICAAQGILSKNFLSFQSTNSASEIVHNPVVEKVLNWKCISATEAVQRFGHQVLPFSAYTIMISGGFGSVGEKHQRLGDIILYHTSLKKCLNILQDDLKHILGKRIFHTMNKLSNNTIVIIGGRSSPKNIFGDILVLENRSFIDYTDEDTFSESHYFSSSDISKLFLPVPLWRHSASLINVKGTECIIVFGGFSEGCLTTNNCFILESGSWKLTSVNIQDHTPSPRHSHGSATYERNSIIISGGLTQDEVILKSFHMFESESMKWKTMNVTGLFPRYSHTSHIWKDYLLLVGGITNISNYKLGVGVVNLKTLQAYEVALPSQNPEFPILLSNHASYIEDEDVFIVGGGDSIACCIAREWNGGYLLEANAGPGILSSSLLENGIQHLRVFEKNKEFLYALEVLSHEYQSLEIVQQDLMLFPSFEFKKRSEPTNTSYVKEFYELTFQGIPEYPWENGTSFQIFSVITSKKSHKFLRFLLAALPNQSTLFKFGRCDFFFLVTETEYMCMTALPKENLSMYRWSTVLYNLFFEIKYLQKFSSSSNNFLFSKKSPKKITREEYFYLIKLTPKSELYSPSMTAEKLQDLFFFVRSHLAKRSDLVIKSIEQWIPFCGPRLIKDGMNVFMKFGDLSPNEILWLFNNLSSWPEYQNCNLQAFANRFNRKKFAEDDNLNE